MKNPHLDTRKNRIMHMSVDIETININKFYKLYFALKIDKSTDISDIVYVLVFIHFIDKNKIVNQFLGYRQFTKHRIGQNISDLILSYLYKSNITSGQCVGICTDEVPSMVDSIKGFIFPTPRLVWIHIHISSLEFSSQLL